MVEAIVELRLILDRPRDDDASHTVEQVAHPGFVPATVCEDPTVVIGVENGIAPARQSFQQSRLADSRHPGDKHARHPVIVPGPLETAAVPQDVLLRRRVLVWLTAYGNTLPRLDALL